MIIIYKFLAILCYGLKTKSLEYRILYKIFVVTIVSPFIFSVQVYPFNFTSFPDFGIASP